MKFSNIQKAIPYCALLLIASIILSPIFSPGFLTKSDSPVHIVEAEYLSNNLLKKDFWINGWYPYEYAGIPIQLYYYQGGTLLVAFLALLGVNIILAYKLALVLSLFLPAAAIYFLLQKHFSKLASFIPSMMFLFQKDLTKLMLAGMWANILAFAVFILLFKKITDYKFIITKKRALVLGIFSAALILFHPFFAIALLYTIGIAFFFSLKKRKSQKIIMPYLIIGITTITISLFYTYPFIETHTWLNPGSGWGLGVTLKETMVNLIGIFFSLKPHLTSWNYLLEGSILFLKEGVKSIVANLPMLFIDVMAIIGFFLYLKEQDKHKKDMLSFTLYFILFSLIVGSGFWFLFSFGKTTPFLNGILAYRFVYYARLGLFVFVAYALHKILSSKTHPRKYQMILYGITFSLAIILLLGLLLGLHFPPNSYTQTFSQAPIAEETQELWTWLKSSFPNPDFRILNQNFFDNLDEPLITKDSILPAMAHKYTGMTFFGSWYTTVYPMERKAQTEHNQLFGKKISEISFQEIKENMEAYNLKYAIAVTPELKSKLESSGLFIKEKEFPHYTVYMFANYTSSWLQSEIPLNYKLEEFLTATMMKC